MVPSDEQPPVDAPTPALRASDAQRERAADDLRRHTAEGRIDHEELEERLTAVFSARTVADLDRLTADLPALGPEGAALARPDEQERRELRAQLVQKAGGAAAVSLLCVVVWLATGASGSFWPVWVILATGAGVVGTSWRGLGPGGDAAAELERLREEGRRRREHHHGHHHGHGHGRLGDGPSPRHGGRRDRRS